MSTIQPRPGDAAPPAVHASEILPLAEGVSGREPGDRNQALGSAAVHAAENPPGWSYEELARGIIEPSQVPETSLPANLTPFRLFRADEHVLSYGDQKVELSPQETALLNRHLLGGHAPLRPAQLIAEGFASQYKDRQNATSKVTKSLSGKLAHLTGATLMRKMGNVKQRMATALSLRVQLTDNPEEAVPHFPIETADEPLTGEYIEPELLELHKREADVRSVVLKYRDHPGVIARLTEVRDPDAPKRLLEVDDTTRYMRWLVQQYPLLGSTEAALRLGWLIEKGLAVYRDLEGRQPDAEQEKALIELAYAAEHLHHANIGLVFAAAHKYGRSLSFAERLAYGEAGLVRATYRYSPARGLAFTTFATHLITGEIKRGADETSRTVRVPEEVEHKWHEIRATEVELAQELGRMPIPEEVALRCGLTLQEYHEVIVWGPNLASLDALVADESDSSTMVDTIADPTDPTEVFLAREYIEQLVQAANLDTRERIILGIRFSIRSLLAPYVNLRFDNQEGKAAGPSIRQLVEQIEKHGVLSPEDCTLVGIGRVLGISQSLADKLEKRALEKLRGASG